ncbi:MAG: TrkH family potassium uptake protein [Deltaproteobacteria bacterium]|nr:MAG: TrkH family potassium uptake protein [Deltaproteobacteria bacterium]RLB09439.1 MAG: TrkH family potassium uptake protein [Deltaproteobacteria bacterium]
MREEFKEYISVVSYLGALMIVMGVLLFTPLIFYVTYGEHFEHERILLAFVLPAFSSIIIGSFLHHQLPSTVPSVKQAMLITALGWLVASTISAIPFMIGIHKSFIDSFFEAASGLTTTGITVFTGLDDMPKSILFWRSLIQWVGGLGILTFFLAVSFRGATAAATLFSAESHKISSGRPVPGIFNTLKILWGIYIIFTVSCFGLLLLEGVGIFDALNHCLTAISTGGFSTHDASVGYYSNFTHGYLIEYTFIFFMLMGGINFLVHYKVLTGDWRTVYRDFEIRWFWGILFLMTLLVAMDHMLKTDFQTLCDTATFEKLCYSIHDIFRIALFQVSSLLTSTGYATKDINSPFFPALAKQVFIILMIVGGCVGSTAGGIKILRVGVLAQSLKTELRQIVSPPNCVIPVVVQGEIIGNKEMQRIGALVFSWFALIAVGAWITSLFSDLNGWQSISGMASALGNMGPFYFSVEKMASLSPVIKLTYVVGMIAGRLEILPIFILFYKSSWR